MKSLEGKVAVVAGATRGAGRGIACMLGEAGATVYCTGRSTREQPNMTGAFAGRPENIDETAEMVSARGGRGIPARTDHSDESQVEALFKRVAKEQGRLDVLVNDISEGVSTSGSPSGSSPSRRGCACPAAGNRHAHHHDAPRRAAHGQTEERARRRDRRRRRALPPRQPLLRPRQDNRQPPRLRVGRRASPAPRHRARAHARLHAHRDRARTPSARPRRTGARSPRRTRRRAATASRAPSHPTS